MRWAAAEKFEVSATTRKVLSRSLSIGSCMGIAIEKIDDSYLYYSFV
jgi:hypothetical protein